MKIDGKPAETRTLVIGPGQQGEIDLPWGAFKLIFNPISEKPNISILPGARQILLEGTDNPLGISTAIVLPTEANQPKILNLAIYTIGDGSNATRIIHYTLS